MAQTTEITINYGYTHNMGNYESCRIDISMRKTIAEGDDVQGIADDTLKALKAWTHRKIKDIIDATK
jgi:hypothetical protein